MNQRIGIGVALAFAVSVAPIATQAVDTPRKDAVTKAICTNAEARIGNRITVLTDAKTRHQTAYQRGVERYSGLVTALKAKGYDTVKLEADLKAWNTKILAFGTAFTAHLDALKATQAAECGTSNGAFLDSLDDARTKLLPVRTAAVDARSYWLNTVKPDLLALKSQTPTTSGEAQ